MRLRIKIFSVVAVLSVILFLAGYLLLFYSLKPLIISGLERFTQRKVTVGGLDFKFPLNFALRELNIEQLIQADYVYVSPSIISLLTDTIAFNEVRITGCRIYLTREKPHDAPPTSPKPIKEAEKAAVDSEEYRPYFIFKRLSLEDAEIVFLDRTVTPEGIRIALKEAYLKIDNLYFAPISVVTNFKFNSNIPWREGVEDGAVEASGWINLYKKDMRASLNIKGIDGVYLHPYYSKWVDLEKSRIQQAKLNLKVEATGYDNDVVADCHLLLTDIVFRPKEKDAPEEKAYRIAAGILDMFKAMNEKTELKFTVRTKMDRPEFGFDNIRFALEDKITASTKQDTIETILSVPLKLIEGMFKAATDVTKGLIDGTAAVGKQIRKSAEELFTRERNRDK